MTDTLSWHLTILLPPASAVEVIESVPSVCLSVCPSVSTLTSEPFDLWPWFLAWELTLTLARLSMVSQYGVITSCDVRLCRQMMSHNEFWGKRTRKCPTREVYERSGVFICNSFILYEKNVFAAHCTFLSPPVQNFEKSYISYNHKCLLAFRPQ